MTTTKQKNPLREFIKTWFIPIFGAVVMVVPFLPAVREYIFDAPEKSFGLKEVLIFGLGVLIFTGSVFGKQILGALKNAAASKLNSKK